MAYVLEERLLERNLEVIQQVQQAADVRIILALKAFAQWHFFPKIKAYAAGATASSLYEARLIFEEMGCQAHTYCVAYAPHELAEIARYSSHMTFNSIEQYQRLFPTILTKKKISYGIRVNPEYSTITTDLYNPAAKGSRLGEPAYKFEKGLPKGIEGLHFHTLCESTAADLEHTLTAFETKFGHLFAQLKWVNFGGGHLMTKADYKVSHLVQILKEFKQKYPHLEVILEPGSAFVWQTGYLRTKVLDIHESYGIQTAILDVSFTAHMPDTLEMPYRPDIRGAHKTGEKGGFAYRLGGVSCLAGDYLGEYWWETELEVGKELILEDMIHYTTVKTTMFNGVAHPRMEYLRKDGTVEILREFGYEDYKGRMG